MKTINSLICILLFAQQIHATGYGCANENGTCVVGKTGVVRYGACGQ